MQVILKENVKGTGKAGDIVKVSDGYARNMLIPKGIAVEATKKNINALEHEKKVYEQKIESEKQTAKELADKLKNATIKINAKCGDDGRLFGSITTMDISKALKEQFNIDIDKKKIQLDSPIKHTGKYELTVKLYTEVQGQLNVEVMA